MAKSPEEMRAAMIENLGEKTGKTLEQWLRIAAKKKGEKHGQIVTFLKKDHGLTHGYANLVAHSLRETLPDPSEPAPSGGDLVAQQYSGAKESLKPIYDELLGLVESFGKDVEIAPKKAYVSLRRSKQFALVQPSTKTRVDLGLKLPGKKPTKRLEDSGSFNSMVSHRVRLGDVAEVDEQVAQWLREAYDKA